MLAPSAVKGVLHVYDKLGTDGSTMHGGARLLMWALPRLLQHGYHAELVCLRSSDAAGRAVEAASVKVHYLGRGRFNPLIVFDLLRLIRENEVRVLHAHGYASSNFGRIAARLAGIPIAVHEHFIDPAMPWFQRVADWLLSSYTTVGVGVSTAVAKFMEHDRLFPTRRLLVLSGGVPLSDFHRRDATVVRRLRENFGFDASMPVVGAVGRLATVKGHSVLLDAWPTVLARHPSAKLILLGDGPERKALEMQAAAAGVADSVIFAGFREDVADMLSLFSVFCMPSYSEGLPLALIEAMAVRIPVVASAVGGMQELLTSEKDSLLVPPGQSVPLGIAINRVLGDARLADDLIAGAAHTAARLDIAPFVSSLAQLYDALSREAPQRARRRDWRAFSWTDGWLPARQLRAAK